MMQRAAPPRSELPPQLQLQQQQQPQPISGLLN